MGREIRQVPAHWEHPKDTNGKYIPMFDEYYEDACAKWKAEFAEWEAGTHEYQDDCEFWEYDYPPTEESYMPGPKREHTWFQVYETVSEGTPVTPPFPSKKELGEYMERNGTFWSQEPMRKEAVDAFLESEWVPSGVFIKGVGLRMGIDAADFGSAE